MGYTYAVEAQAQARNYALTPEGINDLRAKAATATFNPDGTGVRAHAISFSATMWGSLIDTLPQHIAERQRISRGDVFDIAAEVKTGSRPAKDVLAASYLWGTGTTGHGAARYQKIVESAGPRLEPSLHAALEAADGDPIAGYAQFYGCDRPPRGRAGEAPWSRLAGLGPAFFTKVLYFSTPGALILDNVLARAVHGLTGMPHLLNRTGGSREWTCYRYAVYVSWMGQTAAKVGIAPDTLEYTLFTQRD